MLDLIKTALYVLKIFFHGAILFAVGSLLIVGIVFLVFSILGAVL